jgi:hypothetical protein
MNNSQSGNTIWKLVGGLVAVIGLVILFAALSGFGWNLAAILPFLPFLLILACPLMMIFMMGPMGHHHMAGPEQHHDAMAEDLPDLAGLPHEQQVAALRHELTRMAWRQESLRQTLEQVEADQRAGRVVDAAPANNQR